MAFNSRDALQEAGIIGGQMAPELEAYFSSLTEQETTVLINTRNRLAAILPDVEAHEHDWTKPEATQQGFDAAMLCACGAWSGSGSNK